jgi:hypothetical protein
MNTQRERADVFLKGFAFGRKYAKRVSLGDAEKMGVKHTSAFLEGIEDSISRDYFRYNLILKKWRTPCR